MIQMVLKGIQRQKRKKQQIHQMNGVQSVIQLNQEFPKKRKVNQTMIGMINSTKIKVKNLIYFN